jgi:hypothetical protein
MTLGGKGETLKDRTLEEESCKGMAFKVEYL